MSRLHDTFQQLKDNHKKALIPYITAGDPSPFMTVPLMHEMVAAGSDIIELGVPFSDPMADGPTIQRASERALQHAIGLRDVLSMVEQFREQNSQTPIVLMGYLNPIEVMGYETFARLAAESGVDGVLIVDMPPEETGALTGYLKANQLDMIFLLAPNSTSERIEKVVSIASGYLYYVSLKGVTGAGHLDLDSVDQKMQQIRSMTDMPVGVGFGVKNSETAQSIGRLADGVVIGSALIERIESCLDTPESAIPAVSELLKSIRTGLDSI
ncbi:MAG: tryptophan synthase subunit alpha [Gammaproteobacteria bacterium]|nr:tryptophan synthase subunit alpha [Gammaproteobacteria bacterium]